MTTISSFNKMTSDCGSSRATNETKKNFFFFQNFSIHLHPSFDNLSIVKKSITDVVKSKVTCRVRSLL
jgi:hypothetical protein